jgi:hypothetical protein
MIHPRQKRLIELLIDRDRVFVRDLRNLIGAENPAQITMTLRRKGWNIKTDFIQVFDRDGNPCRAGYYWMETDEQKKAIEFLNKNEGAATSAPPMKTIEVKPTSNSNRNRGEKK